MSEPEQKTQLNGPLNGPQDRVFLERSSYRQRRLIDAARILPVVGLLLWFVPLVWPDAAQSGSISTSAATLFIFAIWIVLIIVGAFLAWKMTPAQEGQGQASDQLEIGDDTRGSSESIER